MDTTETYIKMCEKAEEIQKGHSYGESDFIALLETIDHHSIPQSKQWRCYSYCDGYRPDGEPILWLPRQDQLQEMIEIGASGKYAHDFAYHFWNFVQHNTVAVTHCDSMEQLWLAFVMKEKYNEVWNEEDWIEAKT